MTRRAELRIERGDRLVGDDELGALHERARDGGALLLAAGKLATALERVLGNADAVERLHGAALVGFAEAAERALEERHAAEQPEADIGENRQPRHQIELLEDDADPHAQLLRRAGDAAAALHGLTEQDDLAGPAGVLSPVPALPFGPCRRCSVDRNQPGDGADQGRLAAAGGADQRHHLAARQGE